MDLIEKDLDNDMAKTLDEYLFSYCCEYSATEKLKIAKVFIKAYLKGARDALRHAKDIIKS